MQRLTIRTEFALQQHWREQSIDTEGQDTALQHGKQVVAAAFPQGSPSDFVAASLANAFARVERCRSEDTNDAGHEAPRPMTLTTLQSGEVHESVAHLPQTIGGFEIDPGQFTDARGRPMNRFDEGRMIWEPIEYQD